MSAATFSIANVAHSLQALKERVHPTAWGLTPLPIIAAPVWWIDEVKSIYGAGIADQLESVHGCQVVRKDEINEPVLIDHDGKVYPILPAWQSAAQRAANPQSTDTPTEGAADADR